VAVAKRSTIREPLTAEIAAAVFRSAGSSMGGSLSVCAVCNGVIGKLISPLGSARLVHRT
jgi:hypothetical protein